MMGDWRLAKVGQLALHVKKLLRNFYTEIGQKIHELRFGKVSYKNMNINH